MWNKRYLSSRSLIMQKQLFVLRRDEEKSGTIGLNLLGCLLFTFFTTGKNNNKRKRIPTP